MILNILVTILKRQFPDVSNISTNELQDVMGKSTGSDKLLIIDTRKREEYDVSFISGAKHLAFPTSESDVKSFAKENISDQTEIVVCYCSLGYRSSKVAQTAQTLSQVLSQGQTRKISVHNLEGSIFQWANEGRSLSTVRGEATQSCHPFSTMWGLLGLSTDKWRWS